MIAIEPLSPEHFRVVAGWLSQPEVNEWLTSDWRGRTIEPTVVGIAVRNKRNRFYLVKCEDKPSGLVALADWDAADGIAMVWYVLGDLSSGGRGVITEGVRQLVQTAFDTLDIQSLHAWVMHDNDRSRRVLEKNGFKPAGRLRLATLHNGERRDRVYFDLTRAEVPPTAI